MSISFKRLVGAYMPREFREQGKAVAIQVTDERGAVRYFENGAEAAAWAKELHVRDQRNNEATAAPVNYPPVPEQD